MPFQGWARYIASLSLLIAGIYFVLGAVIEVHRQNLEIKESYRQDKRSTDAAQKQAAEKIASECAAAGAPVDFIRECLSNKIESEKERYTTSKDLEAQIDMAFWAKWIVYLGAIGIPISVLGLGALALSLRQTTLAISTDREIGHAQVRAYLTVSPEEIVFTPEGGIGIAKLVIKNTGQSPAYNIRYVAGIFVEPHPIPLNRDEIIEIDSLEEVPLGQTLPAGEPMEAEATLPIGVKISAEEFSRIMNGKDRKLHVACLVLYNDVFKKDTRTKKICCYYDFTGEVLKGPKGEILRQSGWMGARAHNDAT